MIERDNGGERTAQLLADNAPVMIWRSDTSKNCDFFNKSWLGFTGRSIEQELGFGWLEGVHPDDHDRCVATHSGAFDARQTFSMDYRLRRHDGAWRWILENGRPYFDAGGMFAGYVGSCIDITQRKQAEIALESALAAKDAMLHELQHRLRNNLSTISALLHLQARSEGQPGASEALENASRRIRSMALVHELVHRSPDGALVDLTRFLGELGQGLAAQTGAAIDVTSAGDTMPLAPSRGIALGQIVAELASEGFRSRAPAGEAAALEIRIEPRAGGICLSFLKHRSPGSDQDGALMLALVRALAAQAGAQIETATTPSLALNLLLIDNAET
jgi:two-component system, sensor histidine kinase PdtaS